MISRSEHEKVVGIADIKVGKTPDVIMTNLGSCIAVCLYSSRLQVGGMLHLMMAYSGESVSENGIKKAKFADTGIPELLRQLKNFYGLEKEEFVAKIFGGAKILRNVSNNIGQANEVACRSILREMGIRIIASQTGGEKGYKIHFDTQTGKVLCQVLGDIAREY